MQRSLAQHDDSRSLSSLPILSKQLWKVAYPAVSASSGGSICRLNGGGNSRRSDLIQNQRGAARNSNYVGWNRNRGGEYARNSSPSVAAGNGTFGCRDKAPKISAQANHRMKIPKS